MIETIQLGASAARMELLDETALDAVNRRFHTDYALAPTLFFEFHGVNERHVGDHAAMVQALAEEHGGRGFEWATRAEDREKLWHARHNAYYAALALRPGAKGWTTDVCVPISRLADCILQAKRDHADAPFPLPLVGHAGDGNFHLIYVLDPSSEDELAAARRLSGQLVSRALAMGGTSTGEHGVGMGKIEYLEEEQGPAICDAGDEARARSGKPHVPRENGRCLRAARAERLPAQTNRSRGSREASSWTGLLSVAVFCASSAPITDSSAGCRRSCRAFTAPSRLAAGARQCRSSPAPCCAPSPAPGNRTAPGNLRARSGRRYESSSSPSGSP